MNGENKYDIILIQPPLYKSYKINCENEKIQLSYWKTMEEKAGKLLGDLPVEASYGILSIASYLETKGYHVKIIDFHLMDFYKRKYEGQAIHLSEVERELKKYCAKFYGITVLTISDNWSNQITNIIRKLQNKAYIFWGGYYPTNNYETVLYNNKNVDFIVKNEGEYIVRNILDLYYQGDFSLSEVDGIYYRDANKIINNKNDLHITNIDELPHLNYELYDEKFRTMIVPRVYSSRGCQNDCLYCTANNSSKKNTIRRRSPKLVVDEIEELRVKYGKKFFVMGDLEFLFDLDHSREICETIIERKLDVKWWCQIYPPNINEEIIRLMKMAGTIQIALGIESINEKSLEEVNKKIMPSTIIKSCEMIKKYNMQVQAYVMLGLPNDDINSTISNIKFVGEMVKDNLIDVTHLSVMMPYPGSQIYNESEKYNIDILTRDPNLYYMNCDFLGAGIPPYNTKHMSNMEIYSLWLFGVAYLNSCFQSKTEYREKYHDIYEKLGLNTLSVLDKYTKSIGDDCYGT